MTFSERTVITKSKFDIEALFVTRGQALTTYRYVSFVVLKLFGFHQIMSIKDLQIYDYLYNGCIKLMRQNNKSFLIALCISK